ncbi:anthranilate synthase component I family protein [Streptomyces sp. 796.1]|uniref:anthranilate synthase component I family protein n=1 Tax=Streptomyces sp. 796.1 TaxID=3163029 RepID=UPI0039C8D342
MSLLSELNLPEPGAPEPHESSGPIRVHVATTALPSTAPHHTRHTPHAQHAPRPDDPRPDDPRHPLHPLRLYEALGATTRSSADRYLFESLDGPESDRHFAAVGCDRLADLHLFADHVELVASGALRDRLAAALDEAAGVPRTAGGAAGADATAAGAGVSASPSGSGPAHGDRLCWPVPDQPTAWRLVRAAQGAFTVSTDVPADTFAFGFLTTLSYEAAWAMERLPAERRPADLPRCSLTLFRDTVWYDLRGGTVHHLAASAAEFPAEASAVAPEPLSAVLVRLVAEPPNGVDAGLGADAGAGAGAGVDDAPPAAPRPDSVQDTVDKETFIAHAKRCLGHIEVGDVYQIQIGHRIDVRTALTPLQVYRRLRHRNPSPYMYLAPWAGRTVIGASPELFLRLSGDTLTMRPIAGTVPRSPDAAEDARRVAELRASAKEQAEHVMLVDLCRNDIGRVSVPGTLAVDTMMDVEPFASVHHLVSTVSGQVRPGTDVWSAICASFPAGTMTGAPKLRAMELIHAIEEQPRGCYAGAIGLVDVRGFAVFALCIRTAVYDGETYSTQASAGVVADSVPAAEWQETLAKLNATHWALTGEELL